MTKASEAAVRAALEIWPLFALKSNDERRATISAIIDRELSAEREAAGELARLLKQALPEMRWGLRERVESTLARYEAAKK